MTEKPDFRATLAPLVSQICNRIGVMQILDYRCGASPIMNSLKVGHNMRIQCYDPQIDRFKAAPLAADLVFYAPDSEPDDETLDEIEMLTGAVCVFALQTEVPEPWIHRLADKFDLHTYQRIEGGFYAILYCKPNIHLAGAHSVN